MGCLPRSACLRSNELDHIPPILERINGDKNGTKEHPMEECSVHESTSGIYSSDYASSKEPIRKSKRVKRPAKKSSDASTAGVVIRETHRKSLSKKKEKMIVEKRKGIDFLLEVALTEEPHEKGLNSGHETDENESGFESDQEENKDDEEEKKDEFVKIPLNEPVDTDEGLIQKEGTDAKMTNVQQGNENPEITLNQFIEDAHVTLSTVLQKTTVLVTRSSHSSDLASKFLNFSDIPYTDAEIVPEQFLNS
nr:hypothetical protein [Tanacetum cinerariifolium]